jgi:hypothetical protein
MKRKASLKGIDGEGSRRALCGGCSYSGLQELTELADIGFESFGLSSLLKFETPEGQKGTENEDGDHNLNQ